MAGPKDNRQGPPNYRGNLILRYLPVQDVQLLVPHLRRVVFQGGEVVAAPHVEPLYVYFPESAVLCLRGDLRSDYRPVIGVVGFEGLIGWSLLMGTPCSPLFAIAEMHGGTALRLPVAALRDACGASEALQLSLLRYAQNFIVQMACTIGSNATDGMERRIARWLLMLHDRSIGDALEITHELVACALHVRRASVTDCLHVLEGENILRCTRGRILIRDRSRLEVVAGVAYGAVEKSYADNIGAFARRDVVSG